MDEFIEGVRSETSRRNNSFSFIRSGDRGHFKRRIKPPYK
jgi:hypothetical protein